MIVALTVLAFAQDAPVEGGPPVAEAPAAAAPITYVLDGQKSWLGVLVKYDRTALMAGHDHIITPSAFTGTVTWGPDLSACKVAISFPVDMLQVDPPGSRDRVGLEGETKDGDKESIKKNLAGKHQLDASKFPKISFESSSCTQKGDTVAVAGKLSIHGVAAEVTANMKVDANADGFKAKGTFTKSHKTWGMDPFTALLGSLRNDDALTFSVDVVGKPQ